MNMILPRREAPAVPKMETAQRQAGLARDLARAGYLVRRRAWRHIRDEFAGHAFAPLAQLSGAIADTMLTAPNDLIWPARILVMAKDREPVADLLQALGGGHG